MEKRIITTFSRSFYQVHDLEECKCLAVEYFICYVILISKLKWLFLSNVVEYFIYNVVILFTTLYFYYC